MNLNPHHAVVEHDAIGIGGLELFTDGGVGAGRRVGTRDVACFQTKAIFINTTRKKQDARSTNKIQDCLIGTLELELDGEKL